MVRSLFSFFSTQPFEALLEKSIQKSWTPAKEFSFYYVIEMRYYLRGLAEALALSNSTLKINVELAGICC